MKDDYLWDGSGEPDPQVQKLETVLGRYRHNQPAPAFDQVAEIRPVKRPWRFLNLRLSMQLGTVAACLVVSVALYFYLRPPTVDDRGRAWEVARLAGAPRIGLKAVGANAGTGKLSVGQTLVTDSSSRANITLNETGTIDVEAGSRIRVVQSGRGRKRLSLERGTIHATIWAPPGEFVVDTPSAVGSSPLAPCVPRAQRSVRAHRILKMLPLPSAKLCLDLTLA